MQRKRVALYRYFPLFSIVHPLAKENRALFVRSSAISVNVNHRYWSVDDRTKDIWPLFGQIIPFGVCSLRVRIRIACVLFSRALTIEIFRTIDYSGWKGIERGGETRSKMRDRHGARQLVFYISSADLISGVLVHHGHRNRVTMQPGYQILRILDKSGPTRMCFYFWHSGWSRLSVPRTLFFPYFYFFFLHDLLVATSPATRFSCLFHYG